MGADSAPLVNVSGLRVIARTARGETVIVNDVSFDIARGEVVALIGESGSGKTTIALSLLGYARPGCRIAAGSIRVGDTAVRDLSPHGLTQFRGRQVSYIAQSAAASFNPSQRVMAQVIESARIHHLLTRPAAEAKARALFRALALPDPERVGRRFPHQVSGGQLQRLMAVMALITDPELVIMDEPTTALDVTTQIEVLRAFKSVVKQQHTTALYVSHDLSVVAQIADRIIVLRDGAIQEVGATARILSAPTHAYTQSLLAAADPASHAAPSAPPAEREPPLLRVQGLIAGYGGTTSEGLPYLPVLHDVDLTIQPGSVLGVIGESGSGKSTLARVVAGLLPAARGSIALDGEVLPARASQRTREQLRRIQIVFQSADVALNPAHRVARILARPLRFYHGLSGADASRRVRALLDMVRLSPSLADRYPAELSGGQKQRVNLARALAAEPSLILCDEVTSALDTIVGAAILDLLAELRRELGLAYMFISHDLSTVRAICDEVMILYAGHVVEYGGRSALLTPPRHPYTDLLISSVPELRPGWLDGISMSHLTEAPAGTTARSATSPNAFVSQCAFVSRCAMRLNGVCDTQLPPVRRLPKGTAIRCHRTEHDLLVAQGHPAPLAPPAPPATLTQRAE
jgi:peptide/nickel transport system ATP-binding protein